jgi:hypothetical protein
MHTIAVLLCLAHAAVATVLHEALLLECGACTADFVPLQAEGVADGAEAVYAATLQLGVGVDSDGGALVRLSAWRGFAP